MSQLQEFCDKHEIKISSIHLGITQPTFSDREMDEWSCTIHCQDRKDSFRFYTSLEGRKLSPNVKKEKGGYYCGHPINHKYNSAKEVALKGFSKPVLPNVADLLSSLIIGAYALDVTFEEWCSEFGFNNDSIKARDTYHASQQNGIRIKRVLGELFDQARQQEH